MQKLLSEFLQWALKLWFTQKLWFITLPYNFCKLKIIVKSA